MAIERERQEAERERRQQAEADRLTQWQTTYGTTQRELELWQMLLAEFQRTLPADVFFRYVAETVLLSLNEGEAVIGFPQARARGWLEQRFRKQIERTLASALKQKVRVTFVTLPARAHEGGSGGLRC